MAQLADRLIQPCRELSQAAWDSQGSRDEAVLSLCPALGEAAGGLALGEMKCSVEKGNVENPLSVQRQVAEGRSWEGKGEGDGAGSLCPGVWGAQGGTASAGGTAVAVPVAQPR